jgi:hypothetical protein
MCGGEVHAWLRWENLREGNHGWENNIKRDFREVGLVE